MIMHQSDRRMCLDAEVKRGAECNTDHQFLCARIRGGRGELQKEGTSEWRGGGGGGTMCRN